MSNVTYSNPIQVPIRLVTRARAKKFKEALKGLIQASWAQSNLWIDLLQVYKPKLNLMTLASDWSSNDDGSSPIKKCTLDLTFHL